MPLTRNTASPYKEVIIYTDGSCDPGRQAGGWAAIIFLEKEKIVLQGKITSTSHQRMELEAVIQALLHLEVNTISSASIVIYTDSQYVKGIQDRKEKLKASGFSTKKNNLIRNADLITIIIGYSDRWNIRFEKVQAHLKKTERENPNREVDKLSRKLVRQTIETKQP